MNVKDKTGCLQSGFITVAGMILVVFLVMVEMMDLFERACPACFGR